MPLANPDFAPFLQRARDLNPDTFLYSFRQSSRAHSPSNSSSGGSINPASSLSAQAISRTTMICRIGRRDDWTVTALNYSASHNSAVNRAYVEAFKKAND